MPIFYKITKDNKTSHLLGTAHMDDAEVVTVSDEVKVAFEKATCFLMEVDPAEKDERMSTILEEWKTANAEKVGTLWTYSEIKFLTKLFKDSIAGTPDWDTALFNILELPPLLLFEHIFVKLTDCTASSSVLDYALHTRALAMHKPIVGLEKQIEQVKRKYALDFSYEDQVALFRTHDIDKIQSILDTLKEKYLAGDLESFHRLCSERQTESDLLRRFYQMLLTDRDQIHAEAMMPALQAGNAFVAIGAMHLPGVIAILTTQGFTVETVSLGPRIHPVKSFGYRIEREGINQLMFAIEHSDALTQFTLDHPEFDRAGLTEQQENGQNALMCAITQRQYRDTKAVEILLQHKNFNPICFTQQNTSGQNALMLAFGLGQGDVFNLILNHPHFPDACLLQRDIYVRTIFHCAKNTGDDCLFSTHHFAAVLNKLHRYCFDNEFSLNLLSDTLTRKMYVDFILSLLNDEKLTLQAIHDRLASYIATNLGDEQFNAENPLVKILKFTKQTPVGELAINSDLPPVNVVPEPLASLTS